MQIPRPGGAVHALTRALPWILAAGVVSGAALALSESARAQPPELAKLAANSRRPPIRPQSGQPFVPQTGDWEGTVDGLPASFRLRYKPQYATLFGLPTYGFEDVVLLEPTGCPITAYAYSERLIGGSQVTPVRAGGLFGLSRDGISGGLTGARAAKLSTASGCGHRLVWKLHPAHRRRVDDGTWSMHFADGESEAFTVQSGGRLASGVGLPAEVGSCGGPSGGVDLFIHADGSAGVAEPGVLGISMNFGSRSATGQMTVPGGTCANPNFAMTASLTKQGP